MAWSKSTRISIMLGIDILFFILELTVGFMVHSLALMADAFHMLNDIISLIVGLWAFKIAGKATTDKYSYGWLRAEILGAFFNAVFLIALCVSIILEALTRFIEPPEIENPKLILIVGSLGLASNLVGFLVLGGHGHAHGHGDHEHGEHDHEEGHAHDHSHAHDEISRAEEGAAGIDSYDGDVGDENGRPADNFPEVAVARFQAASAEAGRSGRFGRSDSTQSESRDRCGSKISIPRGRDRRRAGSVRHGRLHSIEDIAIHPASFRQEIIDASRPRIEDDSSSESNTENGDADGVVPDENTPLLKRDGSVKKSGHSHSKHSSSRRSRRNSNGIHHHHNHNKPRKPNSGGHGHNHADMGMNAMILHVLGDALGNVGVIATALIIWLTDWPGKLYADPAVSLFITLIILRSAIPLTIAASKILLQATPDNIDLNDVREDIQALPGVISCHHVHIWQLSDTKIVASLHIEVSFPISEAGGEKYMDLAKMARKCLHAYGIHSATIQPEFCLDRAHDHGEDIAMQVDGGVDTAAKAKKAGSTERNACLLQCIDDCEGQGCCTTAGSAAASSHSARSPPDHDHDHDHDHSHE